MRNQLMNKMINIVGLIPLYSQLQTFSGIESLLIARLIVELGDFSQFDNSSQLIACYGLDPVLTIRAI